MLGKLLKYEFKATGRLLIPLYAAILIVSLVGGFGLDQLVMTELASVIFLMVYTGLFIALFVMTLILIIQRFNNNLLKDEGYLMFTLPVSTHSLLWSKMISSLVWCAVGTVVGLASVVILTAVSLETTSWDAIMEFIEKFMEIFTLDVAKTGFLMLLACITGCFSFLLTVYLSLSVGQIPTFNRHRGLMAFITFFVICIALGSISSLTMDVMAGGFTSGVDKTLIQSIVFDVVTSVLLYLGTYGILSRKLNLE